MTNSSTPISPMQPKDFCFKHPVHFLAYGFGSGLAPKAPGTFGTIAAVAIYLGLSQLNLSVYIAIVVLAAVVGISVCDKAADDLGVHDHGSIVWDEFVGFWITMIAVPSHWYWIVLGFALFRFFDIVKPWPIRLFDERVGGGFGIMIDDVIAGVFSLLILQGIIHLV